MRTLNMNDTILAIVPTLVDGCTDFVIVKDLVASPAFDCQ